MWLWLYDIGQLKNALPQNVIHRIVRKIIGLLRKEFINDQNSHTHARGKNCHIHTLQHAHAAYCNIVGCNMLRELGHPVATYSNTVAKRTHQVPPSNVAICCVSILRSFGRGLTV